MFGTSRSHVHARVPVRLVAIVLFAALALGPVVPAAAGQRKAAPDMLSGTWQVDRHCVTGCFLSRSTMVTVRAHGHGAYDGSQGNLGPLVLLQLTPTQVIVHARQASSILTIRTAGRYMTGVGVGQNGDTFATTWRCVAGPPHGTTAGRRGRCGR